MAKQRKLKTGKGSHFERVIIKVDQSIMKGHSFPGEREPGRADTARQTAAPSLLVWRRITGPTRY
ncbi:hypothetical protein PUN4_180152 [Paraburkholderia unamae]|nr:hypothetical protein PUN4_180152 [Paraburkholderia unamae]